MIVLNLILFLLIALGQASIYLTVHQFTVSSTQDKLATDLKLARRLATVVVSDFLCWFPVGLLGLLAAYDHVVSNDVNVAMAIFVLPLNSALNPFLYTMNTLMEKRRAKKLERLTKMIEARLQAQYLK